MKDVQLELFEDPDWTVFKASAPPRKKRKLKPKNLGQFAEVYRPALPMGNKTK